MGELAGFSRVFRLYWGVSMRILEVCGCCGRGDLPVRMWYVLLRLHDLEPCVLSHGSMVLTLSVKQSLFVSSE